MSASSSPALLQGVHVLVVEDDPDGNELLTTMLQRSGAIVTSAISRASTIVALDGIKPDVLVSDIGLPDGDGFSLLLEVRARVAGLPAVALTAFASRQDAAKAIAAGFDAHLSKPVEKNGLVETIRRVIEAHATTT